MPTKKTTYANQLIDRIIQAAETCDPEAINDFLGFAIESNLEHLNLIESTLTLPELIRRQKAISQGAVLLSLFNHFATRKIENGLGELGVSRL